MPESDEHRELVHGALKAIRQRFPEMELISDLQTTPGASVPSLINGFRPDLYGHDRSGTSPFVRLVAEAKTDSDLDNNHTDKQLSAFINYLERKGQGLFILSVSGSGAGHAKTVLRFKHLAEGVANTQLAIFDSLDFWYFERSGYRWRLI